MDHIFTKKTLSFAMAIVMFFSIFSVGAVISTNSVYADSEPAKPDQSKNAISMPDSVKRGVYATIDITGDRYIDIKDKYSMYINGFAERDVFVDGEEFFQPSSLIIKSIKKAGASYNRTFSFAVENSRLTREYFGANVRLNAGKYTLTATFKKREVSLPANQSTIHFSNIDNNDYTIKATLFVKAKVKFAYNKKYGKLAKNKRTKYLNPTEKYGKLPKPKTKKGYKFVGWYTKSEKGKRVKKSTKVPASDNIILYARYIKK